MIPLPRPRPLPFAARSPRRRDEARIVLQFLKPSILGGAKREAEVRQPVEQLDRSFTVSIERQATRHGDLE